MMDLLSTFSKNINRLCFATAFACCVLSSCDNLIYDGGMDCPVTYRLDFRYDRNMKWADAFSREVHSICLYAFDRSGTLVWQQAERGEALSAEGYAMTLDLPAGEYRLVAWCGLENDDARGESFNIPGVRIGQTRLEKFRCSLNREHDGTGAYSRKKLHALFHGMLDVSLPTDEDGGEYSYTMSLTKNTNHVRVILQHLSGEEIDSEDFTFRIEEENGLMDYDNSLLPDERITYWAYQKKTGTAGMGIDDYPEMKDARQTAYPVSSRAVTSVSVAIADLTTARLTEGRKTFLTIETTAGGVVARIPLTDYALLLKDGYGEDMTDQEYLDRQDEYALTFFLDERDKWIATTIIINSWKVVLDDLDFN